MELQYKLYLISKILNAGASVFPELNISGGTNLGNVKNDITSYNKYKQYGLIFEHGGKEMKAIPIKNMLYTNRIFSIALNSTKKIDKEVFNQLGQLFINNIFLDSCFKVLGKTINHNQSFNDAKKQVLKNENETVITDKTMLKNGFIISSDAISKMKHYTTNILNATEKESLDSITDKIKETVIKNNKTVLKNITIDMPENDFYDLFEKIQNYIIQGYNKSNIYDLLLKDGIKIFNNETKLNINESFDYIINIEQCNSMIKIILNAYI